MFSVRYVLCLEKMEKQGCDAKISTPFNQCLVFPKANTEKFMAAILITFT